ncbi:hypothetical protein P4S95_27275 [Aneurinibacillus aneurinilyticus]|uniref:hypothetical protein n=1 Tax=Aneurinibacillus aneurinilyticus TaxID=1391 RepID=UPI002E20FB60|nr:hypothetical protein [Aneurinibacillus aneurinilyticus]
MSEQTKPINLDKIADRYTMYCQRYQSSEDVLDVFDYATACADDVPNLTAEVERLRGVLRSIQEFAKKDGISKELDECYVLARNALEG